MVSFKYKYLFPFYPLIQLLRIQIRYGFISLRKWEVLLMWTFKLIILEPLRLVEAIVMVLLPEKEVETIFVLGYFRSGTTYLQELMAANKNHRTLTIFQSILPEVSLCFGWLFRPLLSFVTSVFRIHNNYHYHPFDWNYPGEDDIALTAMVSFEDYNRVSHYPSRYAELTDKYLRFRNSQDAVRWMDCYQYFIKKLSYIYPNKILVLKSPPHMGRTDLLTHAFQNPRFIFIHRDPAEAIRSARKLWNLNKPFIYEDFTSPMVESLLIQQYADFYSLFSAQTARIEYAEVRFTELITDPLPVIDLIYKRLGLTGSKKSEAAILAVIKKQRNFKNQRPEPTIPVSLLRDERIRKIRSELGYLIATDALQ